MNFFKKIFNKDKDEQRVLNSPADLKLNDIIVLTDSFALPQNLRAKQFQITAVNSYEFENDVQTEWALTDNNGAIIYLSLDQDDEVFLKFSLKIKQNDVENLFNLDDFSAIFDEPGQAFLKRKSDNDLTGNWTSKQYQQCIFAQVGYFHRKDHRSEALSSYEGKDAGEEFELYQLLDQEEDYGIDVEVWSDGDTDVSLTLYRPLSDIIDMYPAS